MSHSSLLRRAVLVTLCLFAMSGLALGADSPGGSGAPGGQFGLPVPQQAPLLSQDQVAPVSPQTGFVAPPMDLSYLRGGLPMTAAASLPARLDWRGQGKVSPVKNQGGCGACYAFAAMGNLESRLLIDGAGLFDLSENNVKECGLLAGSCAGGNFNNVANFLTQNGSALESCDPYQATDVACKSTCPYQQTVLDWDMVSGNAIPDTTVLKNYISTYGPVYTTMYAGNGDAWATEFGAYNGSYTLYFPTSAGVNHAVLIVGWDDSLRYAGGTGGWIVKNSWGTGWGGTAGFGSEKGYFTIAYGSANIGLYTSFVRSWQNYDPTGSLFYYDEGGWSTSWGYGSTTAWGLAKFVPSASTSVTRIEFWTTDITTDVDVYLYDTFNGSTLANLLASKLNLSFSEAGYHSVLLDAPVNVAGGNDIFAEIKFTNASSGYPIAADSRTPIEPGKTYISANGAGWLDLGTQYANDVAIRIRTAAPLPQPPADADIGVSGADLLLTWQSVTRDAGGNPIAVTSYPVYRSTTGPYFEPTLGLRVGTPATPSFRDSGKAGDGSKYYYVVRAAGPAGQLSPVVPADRVGKFVYPLTSR